MQGEAMEGVRGEVVEGLRYVHYQLGANTGKVLEVSSFLYALTELLIEKGIITEEELNERKIAVAERLVKKFRELGMGAVFQEKEQDKYGFDEVQIDCESRRQLCKAACCKMSFALARQDIEERTVKWDLGHPYMIAKEEDGYCVHIDKTGYRCKIWKNRPVPCRGFDCRNDKRLCLDCDKMIVNPKLPEVFERKDEKENGLN
jgi:Fe-S-cluster containining protein